MRRSSWSCKSIPTCAIGVIKRDLAFKNTDSIVRTEDCYGEKGKARKESVCSHADPPGEVGFNLEIVRDGNNSWETALNRGGKQRASVAGTRDTSESTRKIKRHQF